MNNCKTIWQRHLRLLGALTLGSWLLMGFNSIGSAKGATKIGDVELGKVGSCKGENKANKETMVLKFTPKIYNGEVRYDIFYSRRVGGASIKRDAQKYTGASCVRSSADKQTGYFCKIDTNNDGREDAIVSILNGDSGQSITWNILPTEGVPADVEPRNWGDGFKCDLDQVISAKESLAGEVDPNLREETEAGVEELGDVNADLQGFRKLNELQAQVRALQKELGIAASRESSSPRHPKKNSSATQSIGEVTGASEEEYDYRPHNIRLDDNGFVLLDDLVDDTPAYREGDDSAPYDDSVTCDGDCGVQ